MKLTRRFLAVATSLIFGAAYLIGPLDPTSTYAGLTSTDPKSSLALAPPDMPQATFADLWRVDRSFQSTIHMKNLLTFRPVQVTPALYMSDGTEYDLPSVTLAASGMADLDVNQALADAPPNIASHVSQFGSAALKYKHFGSGIVAGEITMLDVPRSLVFSSPFQMMMVSTTGMVGMTPAATTQTLEGLWWRHDPNMGGFVNVSNTTDHPVQVSTQVMGAHGAALAPETISLNPHGEQILDLNVLTFGMPKSQNQAGGLRVQYDGQIGDVEVGGGLENASEGYSANMPFWQHNPDPSMNAIHTASGDSGPAQNGPRIGGSSLSLAAVGLMVGQPDPSQGFPSGTRFTPYLALRNTTAQPMTLGSNLYVTFGEKTLSFTLPSVDLAPYEARRVDMAQWLKKLGLQNFNGTANLATTYTGAVADLLMAAGAVDQTGSYVFAVIPQILQEGMAKDSSWMVADGYDSMLTLWNPSGQPEDLIATFSYADGSGGYKLPVHLEGYASLNLDVASLIAAQRPDADGNVIPRGTDQGRVIVSSPKGLSGKIQLAISSSAFNVTTATCCPYCTCCFGTYGVYMSPSSATVGATDTTQVHFMDNEWGGTNDDSCSANWTSANTSYANVSAPSCTSSNGGIVTGVAATGGVNINASETVQPNGQICYCQPGCPPWQANDSATVTVNPKITGPNTVWYFSNLTVSGYTTSAALTANGGDSSTTWNITAGSNKITVSAFTGSSINVLSSGTAFSSSVGDVSLTAVSNGQTSASFSLTTRTPNLSVRGTIATNCDNNYGYITQLNYNIKDQLLALLPSDVPFNENWTTGLDYDYTGSNWPATAPNGATSIGPLIGDAISGMRLDLGPIPVPSCNGAGTPVDHRGQEWRIGTLATGIGRRVQTDTLQTYTTYGAHLSITSPAP